MKSRKSEPSGLIPRITLITGILLATQYAVASEVQTRQSVQTKSGVTTSGIELSGRLSTGYLTSQTHDYLYQPSGAQFAGHKNSELIFDIDSMYMLGAGITLKPLEKLTLNVDYWVNIDDGAGTMEDYDWVTLAPEWTHWSGHENTDVTDGSIFDINAGWQFYSNNNTQFSGILGYKRENYRWDVYGGEFIYSIDDFRDTRGKAPDDLHGLTYDLTYSTPYFGLGFNTRKGKFEFDGTLKFSPFASGEYVDQHLLRDLEVEGDYSGGNMFGLDLGASYAFTDKWSLKGSVKYQRYNEERFDLSWTEEGATYELPDSGGIKNESTMLLLSLQYSFR